MHIWRLVVGTSLVGVAGAVAVACSSSSSGGGGGSPEAGDDGSGGDAGGDACAVPASMNVSKVDAGSAWACVQGMCATELTACGKSCDCNSAVVMAEACIADGGAAMTVACFTNAFGPVAADPAVGALIPCLQMTAKPCGGITLDGGEGGTSDAHSDAPTSDAPASDAPASDAPASDAPASDAPASDAPTG